MPNSEFMSEQHVGYSVLKSFLAGDERANRCFVGLSPDEQQRLVSGVQGMRSREEIAGYVWDCLDKQER